MGELTWGTPLFFDLWMAGMAGGAYFAAFLIHLFGADEEKRLLKLATYIGVPLVLLGVLAIIIDLGEPLRAFNIYVGLRPWSWQVVSGGGAASLRAWPPSVTFHLTSPMSLGGWILVIFSVAGVALIVLWFAKTTIALAIKVLTWIGFAFAVLVMTYTGVVLSASSQALWQATFLVPPLFVASATSTGLAALMIALQLTGARERAAVMAQLRKALTVLVIVQLVVLVGFLLWLSVAGVVGPLISGTLCLFFWVGVVLLGLLIPLGLEFSALRGRAVLASPALVLLGGLVLRAVVVIGGQM